MLSLIGRMTGPAAIAASFFAGVFKLWLNKRSVPQVLIWGPLGIVLYWQESWWWSLGAALAYVQGSRLRCIGLTGSIASGKSTVSRMLSELGATIIDADQIAKDVLQPGQAAYNAVVKRYTKTILDPADGVSIDRKALRKIIMDDPAQRKFLNSVTHPRIFWGIFKQYLWQRVILGRHVVLDAPLLFESGPLLSAICAPIITVVVNNRQLQVSRVMARDGVTRADADAVLNAQMPEKDKIKRSDIVIENSSSIDKLQERVLSIWEHVGWSV